MERLNLLVCDLDGTLLGDDEALEHFADWYAQARNRFRLVYSSGRFVASMQQSLAASRLPRPDALIGGVGTEIEDLATARRLSTWPPRNLPWNPHAVRAICESCRELTPQPPHLTSSLKVSFFGRDLAQAFLDRLKSRLAAAGQTASLVYSSNRDLDVLPAAVHKGAAAEFLARRWRVDPARVIVAGDSGNDATMFDRGFRGIVVGNARSELRSLMGPHIYHATAQFAAGVLEGLQYWLRVAPRTAARIDPAIADRRANHGTRG